MYTEYEVLSFKMLARKQQMTCINNYVTREYMVGNFKVGYFSPCYMIILPFLFLISKKLQGSYHML